MKLNLIKKVFNMERKGTYKYSQEELDRNKIIKMQQEELQELRQKSLKLKSEKDKLNAECDSQDKEIAELYSKAEMLRKKALELARKQGLNPIKILDPISKPIHCVDNDATDFMTEEKISLNDIPAWSDILDKANESIEGDVILEDLLSANEFKYCQEEVARINQEFEQKTKLSKVDIAFLMIAVALQTARWIIIQEVLGDLGDRGERVDSHDGDRTKKKDLNDWNKKHGDKDNINSDKYPTWKDIIFGQYTRTDGGKTHWVCPYDAQSFGPDGFDDGGKGAHRKNTLGHDPILGWIFGTANLMTCSITCSRKFNYGTYRVEYPGGIFGQKISAATMFYEVYDSIQEDKFRLPAALFAQYAHLKSDVFTERGLPIPLLDSFSPELAGKLYSEQYDALCLAKDAARVGSQAVFAIFINMLISLLHGFFYNPQKDHRRDFYEVRTRKILLFSNAISSSINLAYVGVNAYSGNVGEALKKLDLGGLLVTLWRLFSDIRFITKVKEQFINEELDKVTANELKELDKMFE